MIKNEIPARIILTFFTIAPIYFAVDYFQSNKPFAAISMLLISVLFLITQVNIKQFLMSEEMRWFKKPKAKFVALQIFIAVISLTLLGVKLLSNT